jgi:hypothetical protein
MSGFLGESACCTDFRTLPDVSRAGSGCPVELNLCEAGEGYAVLPLSNNTLNALRDRIGLQSLEYCRKAPPLCGAEIYGFCGAPLAGF